MSQIKDPSASFLEAHVKRCQLVLDGDLELGAVVRDLRQAVAEQDDLRARTELLRALASKERKPFKLAAMRAIDRILPAGAEGTPASSVVDQRLAAELHFSRDPEHSSARPRRGGGNRQRS